MHHASILHNRETNRFHPIYYRAYPLPGSQPQIGESCRHKYHGHHVRGFDTIDEAIRYINGVDELFPSCLIEQWDGIESPYNEAFFPYLKPRAGVSWRILSTMARS